MDNASFSGTFNSSFFYFYTVSQFEIVRNLLENLRKEEIRSLRRFLQLFEEGSETSRLKSMDLLDLLLNKKNYPEEKVCKKLYGDCDAGTLKTFNKMLLRFKVKVYELLTLDINIYRKDAHDNLHMAVSEVRKMLLEVNILEKKAPVQEVIRLYDKIKQVSKNFELYDELLLALSCKNTYIRQQAGSGLKVESFTEIMFYDRCRFSLLKARDTYARLVNHSRERHLVPDEGVYNKALEELEHEYRYTKSAFIGYFLFELTCDFRQAMNKYDEAEKACQQLISLVSENPAVYRDERMSRAFINLARIELCRYRFKQAEAALLRAKVYGKGSCALEIEAAEIGFLALFYTGQFERAALTLSSFTKKDEIPSLVADRLNFYHAAVKTVMGKTHEALPLLQGTAELEKESPAWNGGIRLLVIMNLLEAEKLDAVESQIENLRKYMERTSKTNLVSDRSFLIVKMLGQLVHLSFDFKELIKKEKNNLDLLESRLPGHGWQPKSPELILFHLWLKSKATGRDYGQMAAEWFENSRKIPKELTLFD